jgi:hypothetical protein
MQIPISVHECNSRDTPLGDDAVRHSGDNAVRDAELDGLAQLHKRRRVQQQIELLAARACALADRVAAGEISFVDAVDMAYSAATWADLPAVIDASGLINSATTTGDDIVQATLAAAFANARRPV